MMRSTLPPLASNDLLCRAANNERFDCRRSHEQFNNRTRLFVRVTELEPHAVRIALLICKLPQPTRTATETSIPRRRVAEIDQRFIGVWRQCADTGDQRVIVRISAEHCASRLETQTDRRDEVCVAFEQGASNVNKATAIVVDVCERVEH